MAEHNETQFVVNSSSSRLPNSVIGWVAASFCGVLGFFIMNLNRNVEELLLKVNTVEIRLEGYNSLAKRVELLEMRMTTSNASKAFLYDQQVNAEKPTK
jgi:hypothetical protein